MGCSWKTLESGFVLGSFEAQNMTLVHHTCLERGLCMCLCSQLVFPFWASCLPLQSAADMFEASSIRVKVCPVESHFGALVLLFHLPGSL